MMTGADEAFLPTLWEGAQPGTGAITGAPGGDGREDETSIIRVWLKIIGATFPVELVTAYSSQIT